MPLHRHDAVPPGEPMLALVDDDELDARKHLRVLPEE